MRLLILVLLTAIAVTPAHAEPKPPYWASLGAGEVMMRKGPGRNFPADWLYTRRDLPVKVIESYVRDKAVWRKIEDPDGTKGWVQANLLSDKRTGLIIGDVRPLYQQPNGKAAVAWRAEPGVVGRISQCANGWCAFDTNGKKGFVEVQNIVGLAPGETLP